MIKVEVNSKVLLVCCKTCLDVPDGVVSIMSWPGQELAPHLKGKTHSNAIALQAAVFYCAIVPAQNTIMLGQCLHNSNNEQ